MRPEDRIRIEQMISACETLMSFTQGRTREDLESDLQFQFAAAHALQIALEAASRLHAETKAALPAIAWIEMGGMRNRLVHAYAETDLDILWRTITEAVPDLLDRIRSAISGGDP